MKTSTILIAGAAIAALLLFSRKASASPFGRDLGNGWTLNPDGRSATGPNGARAVYTGYMTGDIHNAGGYLTL